MAFVFDCRRAELSGLARELLVPEEWLEEVGSDQPLTGEIVNQQWLAFALDRRDIEGPCMNAFHATP
jgi:hypothetical protein